MVRCQQTYYALQQDSDVTPQIVTDFTEQNFGDWEQLSYDVPEVRDAVGFWLEAGETAPPNGESYAQMAARVHQAIGKISDQIIAGSCTDVIVIAHAGVIRAAAALALDLPPTQALRLEINPLSLTRITRYQSASNGAEETGWSVKCLNQKLI